jgi:hypothetical protein
MSVDRTRYRQIQFIGERILQARELNWLQEIKEGVFVGDDETPVSGTLQTIYRQGATFNITPQVSGFNVSFTPTEPSLPMYIYVRDQWEIFPGQNDDCTDTVNGTQSASGAVMTLVPSMGIVSGGRQAPPKVSEAVIYLNWEYRIRTSTDDSILTDSLTGNPTANAGELILHLNVVDTSTTPLQDNQLAINTSPIILFTFSNSGTSLTYTPIDNILTQAYSTTASGGLVRTTTNTPIAVSTDDPRLSSGLGTGAVFDSIVRTPISPGGTNYNGTTVYKLPTDGGTDPGGISATKIILINTTQALEDGWNWLVNSFNSLLSSFNSHYTAALGLSNTHPLPTASQVGATPLSHVGQDLGLSTSHPPIVNAQSGGFKVNQSVNGSPNDPAYGIFTGISNIASINHDGDIFSTLSQAFITTPGGTGVTISGNLGHISTIAGVLSQHVNQTSHCNPHGLTASDIGALTTTAIVASLVTNGYVQIPVSTGTLIIQWGITSVPVNNGSYQAFPIAFPNATFSVMAVGIGSSVNIQVGSVTTAGFKFGGNGTYAYFFAFGH